MNTETVKAAKIVRQPAQGVEPLYPAARLLKGAIAQADELLAAARVAREQAERDAAALRDAAKADSGAIREQARRDGAGAAVAELRSVIERLETEITKLRKQFADAVPRVALVFAEHILKAELETKPDRVVDLVARVMRSESNRLDGAITLHVHPEDAKLIRGHLEQLKRQLPFADTLELREDHEVERYGVQIETRMGTYDGSLRTQLASMRELFLVKQDGKSGGGA